MKYIEKTIKSEKVFDGRVVRVFNDDVSLPDGKMSKREIVRHNGGCCILPVLEEKYFVLVKQYRYAYGEEIYEIPAGKLEKGESPKSCAIRELKEETGYLSDNVTDLGILYPTPGYTDEKIYIYIAQNLVESKQSLDDGEFLDVEVLPIERVLEMIESNEIRDSKTIVAVMRYINNRNKVDK